MRPGHNCAITCPNRRTRTYGTTIRKVLDAQRPNQVTAGHSGTVTSSCDHNPLSLIPQEATKAKLTLNGFGKKPLTRPVLVHLEPHLGGRVTFRGNGILAQTAMGGQRRAAVNWPRFALNSRRETVRTKRDVQTPIRIYGSRVRHQELAGDFNSIRRRFLPPQSL